MALADELRKYHTTVSTLNEILEMDGIRAEETTQNEPPDPTALPERVVVKGWNGENLNDLVDHRERSNNSKVNPVEYISRNIPGLMPDAEYAAQSLHNIVDIASGPNPNSGYLDFLSKMAYQQRSGGNPNRTISPSDRMKLANHIMKKFPTMLYHEARDLVDQYIADARKRGIDPMLWLDKEA